MPIIASSTAHKLHNRKGWVNKWQITRRPCFPADHWLMRVSPIDLTMSKWGRKSELAITWWLVASKLDLFSIKVWESEEKRGQNSTIREGDSDIFRGLSVSKHSKLNQFVTQCLVVWLNLVVYTNVKLFSIRRTLTLTHTHTQDKPSQNRKVRCSYDTMTQCSQKTSNNQPLNYSLDLSGHRATPPLILPHKNPDILIDLFNFIICIVHHKDSATLEMQLHVSLTTSRPRGCHFIRFWPMLNLFSGSDSE